MKAASAFVGTFHCEPGHHAAFLQWHDLDHRPENLGQIGHLFHSQRWIAPPGSLAAREYGTRVAGTEPGEYLMSYWSSASPEQLRSDMIELRDRLDVLGRCEPMGRDFTVPWHEYLRPLSARADPRLGFSPAAVPFLPHEGIVLTVGCEPDDGGEWRARYDGEVLPELFAGGSLVGAVSLATRSAARPRGFVHLHYTRGNPVQAQPEISAAVGGAAEIAFRAAYVPQHWSKPGYFD